MTADTTNDAPALASAGDTPPRLEVRYNKTVQAMRTVAILAIAALCAFIPLAAEERGPEVWQLAAVLVAAALAWAAVSARRIFDPTPQVVVDRDGIYVREWMVGIVPWDNVDFIAHSSSVRRSIIASLTRRRRRPYLLFRFVERPSIVPTADPPLAWWQRLQADSALQEPVIQQFGLDTQLTTILRSIQDHIAYWQSRQGIS